MAISKEFKEAVQAGKTRLVRIMLKNSLLVDPTGVQFDEMDRYAAESIGNIYTEHDGEVLNFDVSSWNEAYLNQQMVTVISCFSKERVALLKSMVRVLYKEKADKIRSEARSEDPQSSQSHISRKQVGAGVTVAGAALAVAGICTSQTVLTIGGVVAVAAGVALIVSDKGGHA